MKTHLLILTAALLAAPPAHADHAAPGHVAELPHGGPPPAQYPQDPADGLYRQARTALNQGEFRRAAELFRQIPVRYGRSAYAPDALYWEAFALYRLGGPGELKTALTRLDEQRRSYPRAATRNDGDALAARIRGSLARQGDAAAAVRVARDAVRAAEPTVRATTEAVRAAEPAVRRATEAVRAAAPNPRSTQSAQQANCPNQDDDARAAALNALLQVDADQAVPIILRVLERRDACSGPLREQALFLLAQHRTPETERTLLEIARGDPDPEVRGKAVFWLSQVPGERSLAVLEEILRAPGDADVRRQAVFAIAQHPAPRAAELIRSLVEQESLPMEFRAEAVFWMSQAQGVTTPQLAALYDRLDERPLRDKVLFALSQRGDAAAVDKLIELARGERDPELRRQAIFWLGQSRDPRAVRTLADLIAQ